MPEETSPVQDRPAVGAFCIGLGLAVLALLGVRTIADPDFWQHLNNGRWIAEHGIPRQEVFTFTRADTAWVCDTWLYDQLLYRLWDGGPSLIILFHVAAAVAAFALLLPVARRYASGTAIGLALMLSAWLLAPVHTAGPQIAVLAFPAAMILLLHRKRPAWLLWAGVLLAQVLWTNMHISFLLGPAICAAFIYDARRRRRDAEEDPADEGRDHSPLQVLWITVAAAAVTFINPNGTALHAHAYALWSDPAARLAQAWISPYSALFASGLARHLVTLGLAVGAGGLLAYRQRLPGGLTVVAVLGAALTMSATPQPQLFGLLAFPFFALSLASVGQFFLRRLRARGEAAASWGALATRAAAMLIGAASLVAVFSGHYFRSVGSPAAFGVGINYDLFPKEAAALLDRPDFPDRTLNLAMDGAYLAWRYPQRRVFVDQRARVFGEAFYLDWLAALGGDAGQWAQIVETWDPGAIILNATWPGTGGALRHLLGGRTWRLAYFDGSSVVLLRKSAAAGPLGDREAQTAGLESLESARQAFRTRLRDEAGAAAAPRLIGAGGVLFALERFPEALAAYELITRAAPRMSQAWARCGICLLQQGDARGAIPFLEQAGALMKKDVTSWLWLSKAYASAGQTNQAHGAYARAQWLDPEQAKGFGNPLVPDSPVEETDSRLDDSEGSL